MRETWDFIQAHYGWFIAAIVTIQGFVEKSEKLTKKPLTALLRWVGNLFNGEVLAAQKELKTDLAQLRTEVTENELAQWRYQIIDFASRCQNGTKDQFAYALAVIDKYYTKKTDHNGEVKLSVEVINEQYKKAIEEGRI